jgi:hypothetical protein
MSDGRRVNTSNLALSHPWMACTAAAAKMTVASWRFQPTGFPVEDARATWHTRASAWPDGNLRRYVQRGYATCRPGAMTAVAVPVRDGEDRVRFALSTTIAGKRVERVQVIRRLLGAGDTLTRAYRTGPVTHGVGSSSLQAK